MKTFRLILIVSFVLAAAASAHAEKYALVIGLNDYLYVKSGIPELKWAANDVDALESILTDRGYKVHKLKNLTANRNNIIAELERIAFLAKETDAILVYFAGHGVRYKAFRPRTYWLTYDAHLDSLDVAGIRLAHLLDYIADIPAHQKVVLLDHCFSGDVSAVIAVADRGAETSSTEPPSETRDASAGAAPVLDPTERGGIPHDLADTLAASARGMMIFAAGTGPAYEIADLHHGAFTAILIHALTTADADKNPKDGKLSIDELKAFIATEVVKIAPGQKTLNTGSAENTEQWFIVDNLPVGDQAEVEKKVQRYGDLLTTWLLKKLISAEERTSSAHLFSRWKDSVIAGGSPLTDKEAQILGLFRDAVENDKIPEKDKAEQVAALLRQLAQ